MSATTISAVLGKLGGISAHYNAFGELTDAQAFDDLDGELAGTVLDVDHNASRPARLRTSRSRRRIGSDLSQSSTASGSTRPRTKTPSTSAAST
jgi:hypothetical protein